MKLEEVGVEELLAVCLTFEGEVGRRELNR